MRLLILSIAILLATPDARADPRTYAECQSLFEQGFSAQRADDFASLETIALRLIRVCEDAALAPKLLVVGYSMLATAQWRLLRPAEALVSAEHGIAVYYPELDCHMMKWRSLVVLKREPEARREIEITKKIAQSVLDTDPSPTDTLDARKALEANKQLALSHLAYIEMWEFGRKK